VTHYYEKSMKSQRHVTTNFEARTTSEMISDERCISCEGF